MTSVVLTRPEQAAAPRRKRVLLARAPRAALPPTTALTVWVLVVLGALALWAVAFPVVIGSLQEQDDQQHLFGRLRRELSQATAPLGPVAPGRPVALLDVPTAHLRGVVVVEGTAGQDLQHGPGHLRDSVLPGQVGTSVLLGRSLTYGAPFAHLTDLRVGDPLTVTTGQGVFRYRITAARRPGDPLPSALPAGGSRLVLGTAAGRGALGSLAPGNVVYVDALLAGHAVPSPGGVPTSVPAAERPMGRSSGALLALVFWLQALLLVLAAAVWLRSRWGRWQAWLASCPVVVAVTVGASGAAAQLLPNLL